MDENKENRIIGTGASILLAIDWTKVGDLKGLGMQTSKGKKSRLGIAFTAFLRGRSWMENGPNSNSGPLLTNDWWHILYLPQAVTKLEGDQLSYVNKAKTIAESVSNPEYLFQVNGQWYVHRAVLVAWCGDGWDVGAHSVGRPDRWSGGHQVFSRNSALQHSDTLVPAQA